MQRQLTDVHTYIVHTSYPCPNGPSLLNLVVSSAHHTAQTTLESIPLPAEIKYVFLSYLTSVELSWAATFNFSNCDWRKVLDIKRYQLGFQDMLESKSAGLGHCELAVRWTDRYCALMLAL